MKKGKVKQMKFKTSYEGRERVSVSFGTQTRTKQAFRDECDINQIMKKFETTGELPNMMRREPKYGDFSQVPDYQDALNLVHHAHEQFNGLSAKIREKFRNDPSLFLAFVNDPKNGEEMIRLGLAKKPTPPARTEPPISETDAGEGKGAKKVEKTS